MHNENTDTPKPEKNNAETPPLVYPFPPPKPQRKKLLPKEVRDEQQKIANKSSSKLSGTGDPAKEDLKEDLKFLEVKRDVLKVKQELLNQSLVLNYAASARPILNESLSKNLISKPDSLVDQSINTNENDSVGEKGIGEQRPETNANATKNFQSLPIQKTEHVHRKVSPKSLKDTCLPLDVKAKAIMNSGHTGNKLKTQNTNPVSKCNHCDDSVESETSDTCRCEQDTSQELKKYNRNSKTKDMIPKGILINKHSVGSKLKGGGGGRDVGRGKGAPSVTNDSSELTMETSRSQEWDAYSPTSPQCAKTLLNHINGSNNTNNNKNNNKNSNNNNANRSSNKHNCSDTVTTRRSPRKKRSKTPPPDSKDTKPSKSTRSVKLRLGSPKHNDTTQDTPKYTNSSRNTTSNNNTTDSFLNDYNSKLISEGKSSLRTKSDKFDKQTWMYDMICCQNYTSAVLYLGLVVFLIGIIFVAFKLYLTFVLPRDKAPPTTQSQHIKNDHWNHPDSFQRVPGVSSQIFNSHLRKQLHAMQGIDDTNPLQNYTKVEEGSLFRPSLRHQGNVKDGGTQNPTRRVHTLADAIVKKNFVPTATTARRGTKPSTKGNKSENKSSENDNTIKNKNIQNEDNSNTIEKSKNGDKESNDKNKKNSNNSNNSNNRRATTASPKDYDPDPSGTGFFTTTASPPDDDDPSTPVPAANPYINPYVNNPYANSYSNARPNPYAETVQQTQNNKAGNWQWDGIKWVWKTMQSVQTTPGPPMNPGAGVGNYNAPQSGYYNPMYYTSTTTTPPVTINPYLVSPATNVQSTNPYQRWWQQYNGQQQQRQQQPNRNPQYSKPTVAKSSANGQQWYSNVDRNNNNNKNGNVRGDGGWSYANMGGYNPDVSNAPTYPYMYRSTKGPISAKDVDSFAEYHRKLQEQLGGYIDQLKNEGMQNDGDEDIGNDDDGSGAFSGEEDRGVEEGRSKRKKHRKQSRKKIKKTKMKKKWKKKKKKKAKHSKSHSPVTMSRKRITTTTITTTKPMTTTTRKTTTTTATPHKTTIKHTTEAPTKTPHKHTTPRRTTLRRTTHRRTTTTEITFSFTNAAPPPRMPLGFRDDRRDSYEPQDSDRYNPGEVDDVIRSSFRDREGVDERVEEGVVPSEGERVHIERYPGERYGDDVTRFGSDIRQPSHDDEVDSVITERSNIPRGRFTDEFRLPPTSRSHKHRKQVKANKIRSKTRDHKKHSHKPTPSQNHDDVEKDDDDDESGNDDSDNDDSQSDKDGRKSNGDDDETSSPTDEEDEEDKEQKEVKDRRHKQPKSTKSQSDSSTETDSENNSDDENSEELDLDLMKVSKYHPSAKPHRKPKNQHHHHHETYLQNIRHLQHKQNHHKHHHKTTKSKPTQAKHRLELLAAIQRRIETLQNIQKMQQTKERKGDTSFLEKVGRKQSEVKHVKDTCTSIKSFPAGTVVTMGKHPVRKEGKMVYSVRACQKVLVEDEEGMDEDEDVRLKCKDIEYKISGGGLTVNTHGHGKKKIYSIQACRDHREV